MPLDGDPGTELVPRATIEEVVARADKAKELFVDAFGAIANADAAVKAAIHMITLPGQESRFFGAERANEVQVFTKAVALPNREQYLRTASKLVDMQAWAWIVERTQLERLMDKEAKDQLRQQMQYVPDSVDRRGELITNEEIGRGMPPLTVDNVYATIEAFAESMGTIWRRGVANAFSQLDRRFKSHDGFKVGSRVVLRHAFDAGGHMSWGGTRDTLLDIERAFAIIENKSVGASYGGCVGQLMRDRDYSSHSYGPRQSLTETRYFKIRGFKNGHAHLWFNDDDLVREVNKILAEWYGEVIGDGNTNEDPLADRKTTPAKRFGFFPTPDAAAEALLAAVPLWRKLEEPPLTILEPSAGTGNLARRCATAGYRADRFRADETAYAYGHQVDCVEIQPELAQQLRAEGIYRQVHCADFLKMKPDATRLYDRIVMNPPFDLERDIDHITHAMRFLKSDGFLAAIVSAGTEFRETRKARAFRDLVKAKHGQFIDLPPGSFSSVGTNVNTRILKLWNNGQVIY